MKRWTIVLAGLAGLAGCGTKADDAAEGPIAECDAYVATFERCGGKTSARELVAVRASQTDALRAQLAQAARTAGKREEVRARCLEGTRVLAGACR